MSDNKLTSGTIYQTSGKARYDSVGSGAVLIAGTAQVDKVQSGGVVVADRVVGLRKVTSGGSVVSEYVESSPTLNSGGNIYEDIYPLLRELENELRQLERENWPERTIQQQREKLEAIKSTEDLSE
jgi:hypothetical protein